MATLLYALIGHRSMVDPSEEERGPIDGEVAGWEGEWVLEENPGTHSRDRVDGKGPMVEEREILATSLILLPEAKRIRHKVF